MELNLNMGAFNPLEDNEMMKIDGGSYTIPLWAATVAAVAAAYNELYDLGYKVGSWFRK